MYRILIVDDEEPVKAFFKKSIDWNAMSCLEPTYAKNGVEGLKLYKSNAYDVVITDIQMPVMDGLSLARKIKDIHSEAKIIILSCYESFEYAKQALKIGVQDYWIKNFTDTQTISRLVKQALEEIKRGESEIYKKEKNIEIMKEIIFWNEKPTSEQKQKLKDNGLDLKTYFMVMVINIEEWSGMQEKIIKMINYDIEDMIAFRESESNLIGICCLDTHSELRYVAHSVEVGNSIRYRVKQQGLPIVSIGMSTASGIDEIKKLYKQAKVAEGLKLFMGLDKNIIYGIHSGSESEKDIRELDKLLARLREMLHKQNLEECMQLVDNIYNKELTQCFRKTYYVKYTNANMWGILLEHMQKNNQNVRDLCLVGENPIELIDKRSTLSQMCNDFKDLLNKILEQSLEENFGANPIIIQAIGIIHQNYQKEISLAEIANELHVHKGYLCRLFKDEIGANFMQYLLGIRLEKAKELLKESNLKLYEISEKVGFATPQYFSLVFKKEIGISPIEYRKKA